MKKKRYILILILNISFTTVAAVGIFDATPVAAIREQLTAPTALVWNNEKLAVLEPFSRQLKIYTPDGVILRTVEITGMAQSLQALNDNIYLFCERASKSVVAVDVLNEKQFDYFKQNAGIHDPVDIIIFDNHTYILNAEPGNIAVFDKNNILVNQFSLRDNRGSSILYAASFTCDKNKKHFYIFDQLNSEVWVFDMVGNYITKFGSFGSADGQITRGGEILSDKNGMIYISDRYQNRVVIFTDDGEFLGNINLSDDSFVEGTIPMGMAVDDNGMLYIASTEGGGIDIFHIERSAAGSETSLVEQVYPQPGDIIAPNAVRLAARIRIPGDSVKIEGFDFRLFIGNDSSHPLMEMTEVDYGPIDYYSQTVTAEWIITETLSPDTIYIWQTRAIINGKMTEWSELRKFYTSSLPFEFELEQNFPNPFNPSTRITFSIPLSSRVKLEVINILGQQVKILKDELLQPGSYEVIWDGTDDDGRISASGVYFYRLSAGKMTQTRKMVLTK